MWNEEAQFMALFSAGSWEQASLVAAEHLQNGQRGEGETWLVRHALCCMAQGRFAEALQSLDQAVCVAPRSLESLLAGCVVLADLGFYEEASKRYDAALTLARETGAGPKAGLEKKHRELSASYAEAGDVAGAIEQARKALALHEGAEGRLLLAGLLLRNDDARQALEELERARRLAPQSSSTHVLASLCYLKLGREGEAREALVRAETLKDVSATGIVLREALVGVRARH